MIHMDGINTGSIASVRDAITGEVRYAENASEIWDWAKTVHVNRAWIYADTHGGRRIEVRAVEDNDWYDADHQEFMDALFTAEAALKRMLAKRGVRVEV